MFQMENFAASGIVRLNLCFRVLNGKYGGFGCRWGKFRFYGFQTENFCVSDVVGVILGFTCS